MQRLTQKLAAMTVMATSVMVGSQAMASGSAQGLPKAITDLGMDGMSADKQFDTSIPGITGHVMSIGGDTNIMYSGEDENGNSVVFVGMILAEQGQNLTQQHMIEHMGFDPTAQPLPQRESGFSDSDAQAAWDLFEDVPFFAEQGTGEVVMYTIYDPQCPHCATMYNEAQADGVLDNVTIRWVPVNYLGSNSLALSAAIVGSDDPIAEMARIDSGQPASVSPSAETEAVVSANSSIAQQAGLQGTPSSVYLDRDGNAVVHRGVMRAQHMRSL